MEGQGRTVGGSGRASERGALREAGNNILFPSLPVGLFFSTLGVALRGVRRLCAVGDGRGDVGGRTPGQGPERGQGL